MVEVLVALGIFSVYSAGACKLILSHRKVSDMARAHYTAANLAKNRLEIVRTFEFDQIPAFKESQVVIDESGMPNSVGNYRRSTMINSISGNLHDVVVTVDIRNRETLQFTPAHETVRTFVAHYLEPEE